MRLGVRFKHIFTNPINFIFNPTLGPCNKCVQNYSVLPMIQCSPVKRNHYFCVLCTTTKVSFIPVFSSVQLISNNTAARTNPIWISFFGGGAPQAERGDAVDSAVYALCTEHARCNYVRDAADAWRQKLPNYSASWAALRGNHPGSAAASGRTISNTEGASSEVRT